MDLYSTYFRPISTVHTLYLSLSHTHTNYTDSTNPTTYMFAGLTSWFSTNRKKPKRLGNPPHVQDMLYVPPRPRIRYVTQETPARTRPAGD